MVLSSGNHVRRSGITRNILYNISNHFPSVRDTHAAHRDGQGVGTGHFPVRDRQIQSHLLLIWTPTVVLICYEICGPSCASGKIINFDQISSWEIRDLKDPRKKRPFLSTKFVFPLHALKPLQIWKKKSDGSKFRNH